MRVTTTENGWALEEIGDLEWLFLERLPGTASGEDLPDEQKRRILPDPIAAEDSDDGGGSVAEEEEFIADWNEYVRPGLELAFREARQQVMDDLRTVTKNFSEEEAMVEIGEEPQKNFRLEIEGGHSENWYSTLNQARLLMNEVYDLAESEAELYAKMAAQEAAEEEDGHADADDEEEDPEPDGMLWLLLAQYQFYSFIQGFLLERVMKA